MSKKILSALCLISVCILLLVSCSAKTPDTDDFICEFDTKNKTVSVTGYSGNKDSVVIPETFGKYTVTSIGMGAFADQYDISEIVLPKTLKIIGPSAFDLCISIKSITLPEGIERIGDAAFSNCRGLTEITIPKNVSSIGLCVFAGCSSLESITVDEENSSYRSDSYGALLTKDESVILRFPSGSLRPSYVMSDKVKTVSSYAFENSKNLKDITFSPFLEKIEGYAFIGSGVQSAVLGDSLLEIGQFAFSEASLKSLDLGKNIKSIGDSAFSWCTALSEVTLPASVTDIGKAAFYMCSSVSRFTVDPNNEHYTSDYSGVLFDKNASVLLHYPLGNTSPEYVIPSSVTKISSHAFSLTLNLKKVTIPDSVAEIEKEAFAYCANLSDVVYDGTRPESISEDAFKMK